MKYKIVKNTYRKSITLIISPVTFTGVPYLYEKYNGEKYFGTGILRGADYKTEILALANDIAKNLNEVVGGNFPDGIFLKASDFLSLKTNAENKIDNVYPLIFRNSNKDGEPDKDFAIALSSKNKNEDKQFLFTDLAQEKPISKDDSWKHLYALEIEISAGYDDDSLSAYTFSVFHRGISVGLRETNAFEKNDDAWEGFDFANPDDVPF